MTFEERMDWLRKHPQFIKRPFYEIRKLMIDADVASEREFIADIKIPQMVRQLK